jgi:hypothetical protein
VTRLWRLYRAAKRPAARTGATYPHPLHDGQLWRVAYEHPLAQALLAERITPERPDADWRNFAVTLPTADGVLVGVAKDWITITHLTHEVCGHGSQRAKMGRPDYEATYGYHALVLRRGFAAGHMMEDEARRAEGLYLPVMLRMIGQDIDALGRFRG